MKWIINEWTREYQNIIDRFKIQYITQIWIKRIYQVTIIMIMIGWWLYIGTISNCTIWDMSVYNNMEIGNVWNKINNKQK